MFNWLIRSASREKNDNNAGEVVPIDVVDRAVDTLANVLQTSWDQAFDVNEVSRDELKRRCASWARHVSAGVPAPVGPDKEDENHRKHAATLEQRAWAEVQLFFRQHRQKERLEVATAGWTMREVLQGMTARLRAAMAETDTSENRLSEQMQQMEATVRGGPLTHIQKDFRQRQDSVDKVLAERKRHYEGQVATLAEHVQALRTELLRAQGQTRTDALTELFNRGAFDDVLQKQCDYAFLAGQPHALLLFDLDHFKNVNDRHGHPAGDALLRTAADTLRGACKRDLDFVGRYGGEEFAISLNDTSPAKTRAVAMRALDAIRAMRVRADEIELTITASAGVAFLRRGETTEALVKRGEELLYHAKQRGRNQAVFNDQRKIGS